MPAPRHPKLPDPVTESGWVYTFLSEIGSGGFGVVYRATRSKEDVSQQTVAVKVFNPGAGDVERFKDELKLQALRPHERFVHVQEQLTVEGRPAFCMELVEGRSLGALSGRRIPARVVVDVGARVAEALVAAWEYVPEGKREPLRMLHRDLKPQNLMVTVGGEVRVLDLGAAWADPKHREALTDKANARQYTAAFAAPEVAMGAPSAPPEDVYGLAATLLWLVTGAVFGSCSEHPAVLQRVEPPELRATLSRMLAIRPGDRPSMVQARVAFDQLYHALEGPTLREWAAQGYPTLPPSTQPETAVLRPRSGAGRTAAWGLVALAVAVCAAGAAVAAWIALGGGLAPRPAPPPEPVPVVVPAAPPPPEPEPVEVAPVPSPASPPVVVAPRASRKPTPAPAPAELVTIHRVESNGCEILVGDPPGTANVVAPGTIAFTCRYTVRGNGYQPDDKKGAVKAERAGQKVKLSCDDQTMQCAGSLL